MDLLDKASVEFKKSISQFKKAILFFDQSGLSRYYLIVPPSFGLTASILDGISMALLYPALKGMLESNFDFVLGIPVLGKILSMFPVHLISSKTFVFGFLIFLIFLTSILKYVFLYFSNIAVHYLSTQFVNTLRKMIFDRYLKFGKLYFDRNGEGRLHNILITFPGQLRSDFADVNNVFMNFCQLIIFSIIMICISLKLFLIVIFIFPLLRFSIDWIIKRIFIISEKYKDAWNILSQNVSSALSCMLVVKANAKQKREKEWFNDACNQFQAFEFSMAKKRSLIVPIQEIILLCMMFFLVSLMAFFAAGQKAGYIGGYIVFIYLLRRSSGLISMINEFRSVIAQASSIVSEISDIFSDKDKYIIASGDKIFFGLQEGIEIRNLTFFYSSDRKVLNDICINIPKSKMTAIVGPSGAGKTTLIHLLLRFYDCMPGGIKIDGVDIRSYETDSLMKHMAFVSQETQLFNMSLRSNIEYGAESKLTEEQISEYLRLARLEEFVLSLPDKLETIIGDRGVQLSGGEKQRVTLARAMAKGAEILILDEATSALDTATERLIQEAINSTVKGRTSIVIAHRLSTIKNADQIVFLDQGRVIEKGALKELLDLKGAFYRLWEAQKFF